MGGLSYHTCTETREALPFRVLYDGFSGECVLAPVVSDGHSSHLYLHQVASTTTPFSLPLRDSLERLKDDYLKPSTLVDEAVRE